MPLPKYVQDILTGIGLPAEDAAKIDALPETEQAAFDANPYLEKIKENYGKQFKNDPEFFNGITVETLPPAVKKTLESGQYARATNEAKSKLAKALGFTSEEIKDLETDNYKALDYYVPAIAEKWTKIKSGSKETQEQLIAERKEKEKLIADFAEKEKTVNQTTEQKITGILLNAALIGELSAIPGLKINATDIAKTAHDLIAAKYAFERVGDYGVELRNKTNPQMKVLKNGSSQELTLKDALIELATERNWIDKTPDPKKPKSGEITVNPTKDGLKMVVAPHLQDKISKKIAAAEQK